VLGIGSAAFAPFGGVDPAIATARTATPTTA